MAGIKSDMMNKTLPSTGLREFSVGEEEELSPQIQDLKSRFAARGIALDNEQIQGLQAQEALPSLEDQIAAMRQAKANPGKQRLSEAAKRRIELLAGLKQNIRVCTIGDYSYQLRTLKGSELQDAIRAASAFDGSVELSFETRKQLLARAVTHVAGSEIGMFLGDNSLEARLQFLGEELDERICSRLYDEYLLLVNEVTDKYAIKNSEDAQKVAEDLKK